MSPPQFLTWQKSESEHLVLVQVPVQQQGECARARDRREHLEGPVLEVDPIQGVNCKHVAYNSR